MGREFRVCSSRSISQGRTDLGTAFAIGIDVLLADGRLRASELQFVVELRRLLRVRRSVARKMLGVLGTKNLVWTDMASGV